MFCPSCGLKDPNANQYCRACGANLVAVRNVIERSDSLTESGATAREEIGRAVAARIRQTQTAKDLKIVAEEVLPEIEKFLESPDEKRLRRLRTGVITGSVGLGAAIGFAIVASIEGKEEFFVLGALGIVCFFVGLAFVLNAFFASMPRKQVEDRSSDAARQMELDSSKNQLVLPETRQEYVSVVEQTTRNLTKN